MIQFLFGDTPRFADFVYPILAGVSAAVAVLSFAWYWHPPYPRHPLHLLISLVGVTIIFPALLASAATGSEPAYEIATIRNLLRMGWLIVASALFLISIYYMRRFFHLYTHGDSVANQLRHWEEIVDEVADGVSAERELI